MDDPQMYKLLMSKPKSFHIISSLCSAKLADNFSTASFDRFSAGVTTVPI